MTQNFDFFTLQEVRNGVLAISSQPMTDGDFDYIRNWRPDVIVTMITQGEFTTDFEEKINHSTRKWLHFPVEDFTAPLPENSPIPMIGLLLDVLDKKGRVLIHCKKGQGRSAMLAMRLLVAQGFSPTRALACLRALRPLAVETDAQLAWASLPFSSK